MFILCLVFILPTQIGVYPLYSAYSTHSNLCFSCVQCFDPTRPGVDGCLVFILPTLLLSAELPVLIVNHLVTAESRQNSFEVEN